MAPPNQGVILSQGSRERYEAIDVLCMEGEQPRVYKVGAMTEMTEAMVKRFLTPDLHGRTLLHVFSPLLVSGSLSYYSITGNPRHVMPFLAAILDQADR